MTEPKLETAAEVKAAFASQPKLLDRWIYAGYLRWYKAKFVARKQTSEEVKLNQQLKKLSPDDYRRLKQTVRRKMAK